MAISSGCANGDAYNHPHPLTLPSHMAVASSAVRKHESVISPEEGGSGMKPSEPSDFPPSVLRSLHTPFVSEFFLCPPELV